MGKQVVTFRVGKGCQCVDLEGRESTEGCMNGVDVGKGAHAWAWVSGCGDCFGSSSVALADNDYSDCPDCGGNFAFRNECLECVQRPSRGMERETNQVAEQEAGSRGGAMQMGRGGGG